MSRDALPLPHSLTLLLRRAARLLCSAAASLCAVTLPAQNEMVMNMSTLSDYGGVIYADAIKHSRTWTRSNGSTANVNQFGFPTEAAGAYLVGSMVMRRGTYRVYHNGNMTVSFNTGTLGSFTADPATGLKVATWTVSGSRPGNVRISVSNVVTPPTVFAVMRPIAEFSTQSHPIGEMADRVMTANLGPVKIIRFMDPLETNSNPSSEWVHRVRPYEHPRTEHHEGGEGMPIEHVVRLANDMNISPWFCLPHKANDEYIRNVAKTIRYGSNGIDPFESDPAREAHRAAGGTVWEPLASHLHVYVEYSNEVWNSNAAFNQTAWVQSAAVNEAATNPGSNLIYDGISSSSGSYSGVLQARYYTRRAVFISETFRNVFGDTAMMSRVRPLIFWQQTNANSRGAWRLAFLNDYYGRVRPGNPIARPPNYFFWGGGAATYYSAGPESTSTTGGWDGVKDIVWNSGDFNAEHWRGRLIVDGALARGNGLRYVSYEGGPGLGDPNGTLGDFHPYALEIISDPRIYDEMFEHHRLFNRYGGDLFGYFTHQGGVSSTRWGFTLHLDDPIMHKMRAFHDLANDPRGNETFGLTLPATFSPAYISASAKRAGNSASSVATPGGTPASSGSFTLEDGSFAIYDLLSSTASSYQIVLTAAADGGSERLSVSVDGQLLGLVAPSTNGSTPLIFSAPANRRLSLRIAAQGAGITLTRIAIDNATASSATTIILPEIGTTFTRGQTVYAVGAGTALSWQATGAATGSAHGSDFVFTVPTTAASGSSVTLQLTGADGTVSRTFSVIDLVPTITTNSAVDGTAGFTYQHLFTASNADSPLTWSLAAGSLPPGLVLSPAGTLAGTPLAAGTYDFTLRASDANGDSDSRAYTVSIGTPTDAFNVRDDLIVLEAESATFSPSTEWEITSDSSAVGGFFIQETTGANQSGGSPSVTTAERLGTFRFNVTTPGDYRFYVRMRIPLNGNSLFYRINGGTWISFNDLDEGTKNTWLWLSHATQLHALAAGTNQLEIVAREANTQIDRFVLSLTGTSAPTGNGPPASPAASLGTPPPAPATLTATDATSAISLSWSASDGATSYTVKRSASPTGPYLAQASGLTSTTYLDPTLPAGANYHYVVAANNAAGASPNSHAASATSLPTEPAFPVITSPALSTVLTPLQTVSLSASGSNLAWVISGAATAAGSGSSLEFTVPAEAPHRATITATLSGTGGVFTRTWYVRDSQPSIAAPSVLPFFSEAPFHANPFVASGGEGPLTWTLAAGTLPPGISFNTGGGFSGRTDASGHFPISVAVTDLDGDSASVVLVLEVAALSTLPTWRLAYFGQATETPASAASADPDADGLSNLLEYALGLDPLSPSPEGHPQLGLTAGLWHYSYDRSVHRTDLTHQVQYSTDLLSWSGLPDSLLLAQGSRESRLSILDATTHPQVFFRLQIER